MESAPQQCQPAEAPRSAEAEARASVRLTRFRIHPDRRSELVDAACSPALPEMPTGCCWELLVELEDGDWLLISITGHEQSSDETSAHLELADGIVGDEDGAVLSCALVEHKGAFAPSQEGPY